jgi:hypothetical protein
LTGQFGVTAREILHLGIAWIPDERTDVDTDHRVPAITPELVFISTSEDARECPHLLRERDDMQPVTQKADQPHEALPPANIFINMFIDIAKVSQIRARIF